MNNSVYTALFQSLTTLIPELASHPVGTQFFVPDTHKPDVSLLCRLTERERSMRLFELAEGHLLCGALCPAPALRLRVDLVSHQAEVLEFEDGQGFQVVYGGTRLINPLRLQINLAALDWLRSLIRFNLTFRPIDVPVAA